MIYRYAVFSSVTNECINIVDSSVELSWSYPVGEGVAAEDIYLNDGVIAAREFIELPMLRTTYLADGVDGPDLISDDLPPDVNFFVDGNLTSTEPCVTVVRAKGKYRSKSVMIVFDTLENIRSSAISEIDKWASGKRESFITNAVGQEMIYSVKYAEAVRYLADEGAGSYFYIKSEIEANEVINAYEITQTALSTIEDYRLTAKAQVREFTTAQEILDVKDGLNEIEI